MFKDGSQKSYKVGQQGLKIIILWVKYQNQISLRSWR